MQSKRFTPRLSSPITIAALISPCFKKDWKGPALRCGCSTGIRNKCSQIVQMIRRTSRLCSAGLLLREEIDINVGGSTGKSHMSERRAAEHRSDRLWRLTFRGNVEKKHVTSRLAARR